MMSHGRHGGVKQKIPSEVWDNDAKLTAFSTTGSNKTIPIPSRYLFFADGKPWEDARGVCQALGAGSDLVAFESAAEEAFVTRTVVPKSIPTTWGYWIGCNDINKESGWIWASTGESCIGGAVFSGTNDGNAKDLAACTGECDADEQCAAGLHCFERYTASARVPGCYGPGQMTASNNPFDYCYDPIHSFNSMTGRRTLPCTGAVCAHVYNGISGGSIASLTSNAKYPSSPDESVVLGQDGNTGLKFPESSTNRAEDYGVLLEGVLLPPATAGYSFSTHSDDASEVYIEVTKGEWTKVVELAGCCRKVQGTLVVDLVARKPYRLKGIFKESRGSDYINIGFNYNGVEEYPIPLSYFAPPPPPPPPYSNWYEIGFEPNNAGVENCAHVFRASGRYKQWNDLTCAYNESYVCELPARASGQALEWTDLRGKVTAGSRDYNGEDLSSKPTFNDGEVDAIWPGSCFHTEGDNGIHHWFVEFGEPYAIVGVRVTNRADCCNPDRLSGFDLLVDGVKCAENVVVEINKQVLVSCVAVGHQLKIERAGASLHVCGVEVLRLKTLLPASKPSIPPTTSTQTTKSDTTPAPSTTTTTKPVEASSTSSTNTSATGTSSEESGEDTVEDKDGFGGGERKVPIHVPITVTLLLLLVVSIGAIWLSRGRPGSRHAAAKAAAAVIIKLQGGGEVIEMVENPLRRLTGATDVQGRSQSMGSQPPQPQQQEGFVNRGNFSIPMECSAETAESETYAAYENDVMLGRSSSCGGQGSARQDSSDACRMDVHLYYSEIDDTVDTAAMYASADGSEDVYSRSGSGRGGRGSGAAGDADGNLAPLNEPLHYSSADGTEEVYEMGKTPPPKHYSAADGSDDMYEPFQTAANDLTNLSEA